MELVKIEEDAVAFNVSVECVRIKEEEEHEACAAEEEAGGRTECGVSVKEPGLEQHESSSACAVEEEAGGQTECGVSVKEEPGLEQHESSSGCSAEEEAGGQTECGVSAAAARAGLYAGHEVKGELVLGPTAPQSPWHTDITRACKSPVNHTSIHDSRVSLPGASCKDQIQLRPCSVRLEPLPESQLRKHASGTIQWNESALSTTQATHTRIPEKQVTENCEVDVKQASQKIKLDKPPVTPLNDGTVEHKQTESDVNDTECKICFKDFASRRSLYNHLKRHSGKKPFNCVDCEKSFACRRDLHRHSTIHYKENITTRQNSNDNSRVPAGTKKGEYKKKFYECRFCDKVYDRRYLIITHEQHVHFNKKQYKCDICMGEFLYRHSLISHLRIHTGEKPYICKFCGDQFTQLSTLNKHLKLHQRPDFHKQKQTKSNIKKQYKCEICSKRLSTNKTLKIHLKNHRLIHTKVERVKCEFCSAEFRTKHTLKVHLSVGRRSCPESGRLCAICGAKFEQRAPLLQHVRAHIMPPEQA